MIKPWTPNDPNPSAEDVPQAPVFNRRKFYGTIILKEWLRTIDGRQTQLIRGIVSVYQDQEAVGFRTKGNESNWFARVEGPSGRISYNVLGCQIRAVIAHEKDAPTCAESEIVE